MTKVNLIESPYPLQSIKGLGPKRIALLQELNINTVEDLVLYLPTRYEDNTVVDLNMVKINLQLQLSAKFIRCQLSHFSAEINQS